MRAPSLATLCTLALASATSPGSYLPRARSRSRLTGAARSISPAVGLLNASSDLDGPRPGGVGEGQRIDDLGEPVNGAAAVILAPGANASDRGLPGALRRLDYRGENAGAGAPMVALQWHRAAQATRSSTQERISFRFSKNSWIDEFTVYYWGFVLVATLVLLCSYKAWVLIFEGEEKHQSLWNLVDPSAVFKEKELTKNLWVFYLVVASGQARVAYMRQIPVHLVGIVATVLGCVQMLTVYLIVHDIDPAATPVTTKESLPPWKESPWTVNTMKWIQVLFITTALVREIGQGMQLFSASLTIADSRLCVPRFCVLFMPCMQYLVTMAVLYGGVSIILSFQAVPDIIYSSMAITFIANVDDTLYEFCEQALDIDADFVIDHSSSDSEEEFVEETPQGLDFAARRTSLRINTNAQKELPTWYGPFRKVAVIFPCFFAFWLIGRAWYTGTLPTMFVRSVEASVEAHVNVSK